MFWMFWRKKVPATARILADESYTWAMRSASVALHYQKFIIEVYPPDAEPFRTETRVWVNWPDIPNVGATVNVRWAVGSKRAKIIIKGDERYDWNLRRAAANAAAKAERARLLGG